MRTRQNIEEFEDQYLAGYAMKSRESRGRALDQPEHPYRSAFQRDRERIIHSTAFRRLEYKTQVFVNHEGDHYRTRLTHTIEVAQIARTLARALRLNEDLVEALSLAHDLGHTPFGHSGEEALNRMMADHGGFEHNLQSLRVVDILEKRSPLYDGLNLTWEVRESMIKHETTYDSPLIPEEFEPQTQPLLEAQIVNMADPIAYDCHDLDDGLRAGLIGEEDLATIDLWQEAKEAVERDFPNTETEVRWTKMIKWLINYFVSDLIETTEQNLRNRKIETIADVRNRGGGVVAFSARLESRRRKLQDFLMSRVYKHYRVSRMETKARRFVGEIFSALTENPLQLPPRFQEWIQVAGLERAVCDYIAGMTDRYAQQEYLRLFHPFEIV